MIIGSMTLLSMQFVFAVFFFNFDHMFFCFCPHIFCNFSTKKVLYEKIKQKKTPVVYKTDKIANLHGHEVLRNPVRHCELNPIELTWAQVKGFVAKKNTTFRLKDAKELN
jgi:hypothetical protein